MLLQHSNNPRDVRVCSKVAQPTAAQLYSLQLEHIHEQPDSTEPETSMR